MTIVYCDKCKKDISTTKGYNYKIKYSCFIQNYKTETYIDLCEFCKTKLDKILADWLKKDNYEN